MKNRIELLWVNLGHDMKIGQQMQPHSHACFQMYYVKSGNPTFIIDGIPIQTQVGTCFLIPELTVHSMLELTDSPMQTYELKFFVKDPFLLEHLQSPLPPIQDNGQIARTLCYIAENWLCPNTQNQQDIECLLTALLLQFFVDQLHYESKHSRYILTDHYSPLILSILVYIEENYHQKFTLLELGNTLNYNKNYLCTLFAKNTGISIVDYLNFVRIRTAVIFFVFYNQDVYTTCESTGFSTSSHFSRTFKSLVGVSPRNFRRAFSETPPQDIIARVSQEPILNYQPCHLEEAFQSLKRIGQIAVQLLDDPDE